MLPSNGKEQATDPYNDVDESQMHHDKLWKPVSKVCMLCNCIYITFGKSKNIGKAYQCFPASRVWGECLLIKGHEGTC
jgi:hypothetical protein